MNSSPKALVYFVLAVLLGAVSLVALSQVLMLVLGDILAGALTGTPETGWGFLIALYFYGPITLATGSLAYWLAKRYKNITGKSFGLLIAVAVGVAILLGSFAYIYWG